MRWWFDLEKIEIQILTLNSLRGKVNKEKGGVTARWKSCKNGGAQTEKRPLNDASFILSKSGEEKTNKKNALSRYNLFIQGKKQEQERTHSLRILASSLQLFGGMNFVTW